MNRPAGTRIRPLLACSLFAALLWLGGSGTAGAHAELIARSPVANSVLSTLPGAVRLAFSERVLASLSQVIVDDPSGHRADSGQSTVGGDGLILQTSLRGDAQPGPYTVVWTAVAADDGHITQGTYTFVLGQGGAGLILPSVTASSVPGAVAALVSLTRYLVEWLGLVGTALWVGLPLYLWAVLRPALRRRPPGMDQASWSAIGAVVLEHGAWLTTAGAGITLLSTVGALLLQAASLALVTGTGALEALASQISGSHYGLIWLAREVVLVAVFTLGALPARHPAPVLAGASGAAIGGHAGRELTMPGGGDGMGRDLGWSVAVGLVYLGLLALDGHAAAQVHALPLSLAVDALHLLATALWLGGTVGVAAALLPALRSTAPAVRAAGLATLLPAFSPWALGAVAVMAVTGTGNAVLRSTNLPAWLASTYGRALILKIVLFLIMIAVSRYHAFVLRPRLSRLLDASSGSGDPPGDGVLTTACAALERWVCVNPFLAAGVLFCVAVMASSPPPV